MATIYLATYQTTTIVLFPVILLVVGVSMELLLERKYKIEEVEDTHIDDEEKRDILMYTVFAILALLATSYVINFTFSLPSTQLSFTPWGTLSFGILMAVAEEQFFRGFILDALLRFNAGISFLKAMPFLPILASAAIFTLYHFSRYSTVTSSLVYVFFGGFILSFIAYKTRRLGPVMLAHVFNNVASVILVVLM